MSFKFRYLSRKSGKDLDPAKVDDTRSIIRETKENTSMAAALRTSTNMDESKHQQELEHLRRECASMVSTLKTLHEEEVLLRKTNEVLAQQVRRRVINFSFPQISYRHFV